MISVVMSVYNGESFVRRSVESILNQTYTDFELLIANDGSTDNTYSILSSLEENDNRVKIINQENIGLTKTLNKLILMARGQLIARQDADDWSDPKRLESQYKYLKENPDVILLGTNYFDVDTSERIGRVYSREYIEQNIFLYNPFVHSSVMFRKAKFEILGGYDENLETNQDFDLWIRMCNYGGIDILPHPLVKRYIHGGMISRKKRFLQRKNSLLIRLRYPNRGYIMALLFWVLQTILSLVPISVLRLKNYIIGKKWF